MKKLIALAGRKRSGKNTTADILTQKFGEGPDASLSISFSFAGILKDIVHQSTGIGADAAELLKETPAVRPINGLTVREFYNSLGDALKKYMGKDIFVRLTLSI